MSGLLVAGTTSDAGESVVTTGLCRALARRGVRVAPYKAQNMSNNSMVCAGPDGRPAEIGRAQWAQARAAGVDPEPAMNPVLLKPGADRRSHVVLMGHPAGDVSSADWATGRRHLAAAAHTAFDDLAAVVVGDIDRGGVFAAMYGTVALLEPADQALIAGFVVNKFRGDPALLSTGLESLEKLTGRRVYGVLPWDPYRVAVVRLPRISNFTDVDALGLEQDLDVVFAFGPRDIADADLVVLPGTRSTISDLAWLRSRRLDRAITDHARRDRPLLGICGGFQMLGTIIADPDGVEEPAGAVVEGLGLLDARTDFAAGKTLRLTSGTDMGVPATGYETHHGRVTVGDGAQEFLAGARAGNVFGTMWHGSLEGDELRGAFLAGALGREPSQVSFPAARERRFDVLGDLVERHLDIDALLALARAGAPPGLPVLSRGDRS